MKRKLLVGIAAACMILPLSSNIEANEFSGNEDYWQNKCSVPQQTQAEANQCLRFRDYLAQKQNELQNSLAGLDKELANAKGNANELAALVNKYSKEIDKLDSDIALKESALNTIRNSIAELDGKIIKIKANIDLRDESIKKRMISEQPMLGSNMYIDFIMGAKDLVDLMRIMDGIQEITKNDQDQIESLKKDKEELDLAKGEQKRLEAEAQTAKDDLEAQKAVQVTMRTKTEAALAEYQKLQASIEEKMRNAKVNISDLQSGMNNINIGTGGDTSGGEDPNGFTRPVPGSYITERPFYYSGGGPHLGVDYAVSYGTNIVAPSNSLVMYANNPIPNDNGYNLGSMVGHPAGAGNSISLLTQVNGTTYAISFFHLRQANFYAKGKSSVARGEIIAQAGSSGNSTGPHCHIEVIYLGNMSLVEAAGRFNRTADFAYGAGWGYTGAASACENGRRVPCRERPENLFP